MPESASQPQNSDQPIDESGRLINIAQKLLVWNLSVLIRCLSALNDSTDAIQLDRHIAVLTEKRKELVELIVKPPMVSRDPLPILRQRVKDATIERHRLTIEVHRARVKANRADAIYVEARAKSGAEEHRFASDTVLSFELIDEAYELSASIKKSMDLIEGWQDQNTEVPFDVSIGRKVIDEIIAMLSLRTLTGNDILVSHTEPFCEAVLRFHRWSVGQTRKTEDQLRDLEKAIQALELAAKEQELRSSQVPNCGDDNLLQLQISVDSSEQSIRRTIEPFNNPHMVVDWQTHHEKWTAFSKLLNAFPEKSAGKDIVEGNSRRQLKSQMNDDLSIIGLRVSEGQKWILEIIPESDGN